MGKLQDDPSNAQILAGAVAADGASGGFIKDSEAGNLPATATNDNASAGKVGEVIESEILLGAAVSLTTGAAADITSISLTAGHWAVDGAVTIVPAANLTRIAGWVSATSVTAPTRPNKGGQILDNATFTSAATQQRALSSKTFKLAATTTVYLSTSCDFTSTATAHGYIKATRVR